MDTAALLYEIIRIVSSFLLLLFVPGFALSLAIFPRSTDLSIIDRLVYSTVLSISSSIACVVFMDIVLGLGRTLENFILVTSVFSVLVFLFWSGERWYLGRRLTNRPEQKISQDNPDLQRYHSREINATKDRFRNDTGTMVVYHESRQSGIRHIDHSFLMDVGEEIDIQQVAENKLDVRDSYIVDPPYIRTRYFEVVIREYNDEGLSQVDNLQIYPVLVEKNPKRRDPGAVLQPDALQITKRIYQKTSTTEVQWMYSHDFHIFAIIHEEDTLNQMVDRILGKLDEIVTSTNSDIHISSFLESRKISRDAFDTVTEKPPLSHPVQIPGIPGVQPGFPSKSIPQRRINLPEVKSGDILKKPEVPKMAEPRDMQKRQVIQPGTELKASPEILARVPLKDIRKLPVQQTTVEPEKIPLRPSVHHQVQVKDILKKPENKLVVDSIRKLQKDILRDLDMFTITTESYQRSGKNIENIRIPKKADVNKKLADAQEELRDLDWLY